MSMEDRTHLLQMTVADIHEAPRVLKEARHDGQPIVVVIDSSTCPK